jgi:hypothetical protein
MGFLLAQLVNLSVMCRKRWLRSKLAILTLDASLIISHIAQIDVGEVAEEKYFGFNVRNVGRSVATGVRFQILTLEFRDNDKKEFNRFPDTAMNLATYSGADSERGNEKITLVPGAAATIALAWWREDSEILRPCAANIFDYYEEACQEATQFKFHVVAFDDSGDFVTAIIPVDLYAKKAPLKRGQ